MTVGRDIEQHLNVSSHQTSRHAQILQAGLKNEAETYSVPLHSQSDIKGRRNCSHCDASQLGSVSSDKQGQLKKFLKANRELQVSTDDMSWTFQLPQQLVFSSSPRPRRFMKRFNQFSI